MADGILALVFLAGAFGRILAPEAITGDEATRLQFGVGRVVFQGEEVGHEYLVMRDLGRDRPLQPVVGLSAGRDVGPWIGGGLRWTVGTDRFWAESAFMPGLYREAGEGPDLGLDLQFRSSLAVSYRFDNGVAVSVSVDHRSNGDLADDNPGVETLGFRVSIPID
jgi:lipid A 3-O-deacylase